MNYTKVDTIKIIKEYFKDEIKEIILENHYIISYCPDNTCMEFQVDKTHVLTHINDFVYFLFSYNLIYNYQNIKQFNSSRPNYESTIVINRNSDNCLGQDEILECVILGIQKKNKIQWKSVRYDENARNETILSLDEILEYLSQRIRNRNQRMRVRSCGATFIAM